MLQERLCFYLQIMIDKKRAYRSSDGMKDLPIDVCADRTAKETLYLKKS